jgi:hypothetical protein
MAAHNKRILLQLGPLLQVVLRLWLRKSPFLDNMEDKSRHHKHMDNLQLYLHDSDLILRRVI